ncbi:CHAD domain-containing protein [Chloroflexus sp.]|uniref:CHAD domain-containing protein n=1 Tax=Chloroflexus sp. TaxID=1904827 RepID=UPI00298F0E6C|nr:CHAD domain-containing protein [Chloroflexus sp.]MDW8404678.1 CHAD domain-containing protein [Chloroflexus sp.]
MAAPTNLADYVETLLAAYRVDRAHARQVADHALTLFDAVAQSHKLPDTARQLVEAGALLHNVGLTTDPPEHHLVGRDIILRHELGNETDQAILAAIVALHRRKPRAQLEPAVLCLNKRNRELALQLAAIVRVADGFDYSQSQTTQVRVASHNGRIGLIATGPHAAVDSERALAKADLWERVIGPRPEVVVQSEGTVVEAVAGEDAPTELLPYWYASGEVPFAELGRVVLRRQVRRLQQTARAVEADETIEAVHDLRVATRRIRAALRLLEPVAPAKAARKAVVAVRTLAREAGATRDRDVLLNDMSQRDMNGMAPVIEAIRAERMQAHSALVKYLSSKQYERDLRVVARLACLATEWDNRPRVKDHAGSMLYAHYEALRSYDRNGLPEDDATLHAMRIAGKRLRYALELVSDIVGERLSELLNPLIDFQDHLGALNDISVARGLLAPHTERAPEAVAAYLAAREAEWAALRTELPECWARLTCPDYRRTLLAVIGDL